MYSKATLDFYNENVYSFVESTRNVDFSFTQKKFVSELKSVFQKDVEEISLLDFGCGSGRDLKFFSEYGFNVDALDGSEELCREAFEFTGIKVQKVLFQDWVPQKKYNGIWACSSILHLCRTDLMIVLKKICDGLSEKGVLYTSFKYGDFEGERNGRYFVDFTEQSFDNLLLEINCFDKIESWISSDVRKNRENEKWLNLLLQKK